MTTNLMKILKNRSKTCGHSYGRLAYPCIALRCLCLTLSRYTSSICYQLPKCYMKILKNRSKTCGHSYGRLAYPCIALRCLCLTLSRYTSSICYQLPKCYTFQKIFLKNLKFFTLKGKNKNHLSTKR